MANSFQQHLDAIDIALVRMLQAQGRLTNADLAERVGLSPSACLRRVQRLEQDGVIAGYRGIVDPRSIGLGLEAFVSVKLVEKDQKAIVSFTDQVAQWEEVVACYILTGDTDFMLHLVMVDLDAYSEFVVGRLLTAPAMASINSSIVLRTIKEYAGLPTAHLSEPA
jgi:Lrp/AsnC family leucine-responsive transcriptional regulator